MVKMEFYCELRLNDKTTGELLDIVDAIVVDNKSESVAEFKRQHLDEVVELLRNKVDTNIDIDTTIGRWDVVMLADDFESEDECEEDDEQDEDEPSIDLTEIETYYIN